MKLEWIVKQLIEYWLHRGDVGSNSHPFILPYDQLNLDLSELDKDTENNDKANQSLNYLVKSIKKLISSKKVHLDDNYSDISQGI